MKPVSRRETILNEEELTKKLFSTLIIILVLITVMILSFTVFAPAFGSIFKIFSKKGSGDEVVIKPTTPVFNQLPTSTKEKNIKVTGYAQQGSTIKLYVNGPEKASTVTGNDGVFIFENIELINGRNTLFAKSIDQKGNESKETDTYSIILDNEAPKIEITSPKENEIVKNLDKRITITGKVNEKSTITINDQVAIVKADLTFEHILGAKEGDMEIKIKATDEAGNETTQTIKIKYQKSSNI